MCLLPDCQSGLEGRHSTGKHKLGREGRTEVVLTPHSSNFSKEGVGALGVSMNSNSDSEPLVLCGFDMLPTEAPLGRLQLKVTDQPRRRGVNGKGTLGNED